MVDFLIKSTISLGALYLVYILVLSRLKTFNFNRYFLLGSIGFSLVIPLVNIPVDYDILPIIQSTSNLSISSTIEYSGEFIAANEIERNSMISLLPYFYVAISLLLFIRFSANLFSIIKSIYANQKINKEGYSIVLLRNQIIPYSFFKYVLVDKYQYQNGAIDEALIQHEIIHCKEWHSVDIVIVELLKIFFWINPFIWLMKKPMQLNHEYLADQQVLSNYEYHSYKNTLIKVVLKNNQGILISNFNYSLTKQRLKMMIKQFSPAKAIVGKVIAISALLLIAITFSCNQEAIEQNPFIDSKNEWWQPILEAHNVEPGGYNNFDNVFEMGSTNSINDGIVTLKDAFVLIKRDSAYLMLKSPLVYHDLNSKTITAETGTMESFKLNHNSDLLIHPKKIIHMEYKYLHLKFTGDKLSYKAEDMTWDIVDDEN